MLAAMRAAAAANWRRTVSEQYRLDKDHPKSSTMQFPTSSTSSSSYDHGTFALPPSESDFTTTSVDFGGLSRLPVDSVTAVTAVTVHGKLWNALWTIRKKPSSVPDSSSEKSTPISGSTFTLLYRTRISQPQSSSTSVLSSFSSSAASVFIGRSGGPADRRSVVLPHRTGSASAVRGSPVFETDWSPIAIGAIAALFFIVTMAATVGLGLTCRKRNLVFASHQRKRDVDDSIEYDIDADDDDEEEGGKEGYEDDGETGRQRCEDESFSLSSFYGREDEAGRWTDDKVDEDEMSSLTTSGQLRNDNHAGELSDVVELDFQQFSPSSSFRMCTFTDGLSYSDVSIGNSTTTSVTGTSRKSSGWKRLTTAVRLLLLLVPRRRRFRLGDLGTKDGNDEKLSEYINSTYCDELSEPSSNILVVSNELTDYAEEGFSLESASASITCSSPSEAQKGFHKQSAVSADVRDSISNTQLQRTSSCLYVDLQSPSMSKPSHGLHVKQTGCNGFHDIVAPTHIADVNVDDECNTTLPPRCKRLSAVGRLCLRSTTSSVKSDRVPLCSSVSAVDRSQVYSKSYRNNETSGDCADNYSYFR